MGGYGDMGTWGAMGDRGPIRWGRTSPHGSAWMWGSSSSSSSSAVTAERWQHGGAMALPPPRGPQAFYGRTAYVWGSPTAREEVMWGDGGGGEDGKIEGKHGTDTGKHGKGGGYGEMWGGTEKHGKGANMGRTWGDMERACGGCGVWGDVRTWEGHGETWEGHGETWKERVRVGGDMERYRVT